MISCPLVMKIRSSPTGLILRIPVKLPKAGRTIRFFPTRKQGERRLEPFFPSGKSPGEGARPKGPLFSFDRQVAKVEIELRPWIRMTVNSQFGPRVPGLKVMISSNQVDFEIRHLFSPSIKFLANDLRSAISCVEEVTEQNKGVCFCPLDQILNALAILGGGGFGYGYSGLAESRRFSEMGVGNQKRLLVRPVDRFPRTKFELVPLPDDCD